MTEMEKWKQRALAAEAKVAKVEARIGYVAQWLIDRAALSRDPMVKSGLIAASRYLDENLRAVLADGDKDSRESASLEPNRSDSASSPVEQRAEGGA